MRIAKYLAHAGVASRRGAERLIEGGRVTVNGTVVTDPAVDVGGGERIELDGRVLKQEAHEYFLVNKPAGYVSTVRDPQGRPKVTDLVPARGRVYPVGRLDADSTGLVLLTNDGELANLLTHPRYRVKKTYRVRVQGRVGREFVRKLRQGIRLEDGSATADAVRLIGEGGARPGGGGARPVSGKSRSGRTSELEITIHQGRKRQVRRMCEAAGHEVISLERIQFGPLKGGGLKPGQWRRLRPATTERLRRAVWKNARS